MAIKSFRINFAGQNDIHPRLGRLLTDNTLAEVTAAGYINKYIGEFGINLEPTDVILVAASNGTQFYKPVFSGNTITLTVLP